MLSKEQPSQNTNADRRALLLVKVIHTVLWGFFVLCIVAISVMAYLDRYVYATCFVGIVFVEVLVLLLNGWQCPLTPVAGRFTSARHANFDIFLPEWLARHNKVIFGVLYIVGIVFLIVRWATQHF